MKWYLLTLGMQDQPLYGEELKLSSSLPLFPYVCSYVPFLVKQ